MNTTLGGVNVVLAFSLDRRNRPTVGLLLKNERKHITMQLQQGKHI
jgi:hypothetical protein